MVAEPVIDLEACFFLNCDFFSGKWHRVPVAPLEAAFTEGRNVLLIDYTAKRHELLPVFMLEEYVNDMDDSDYRMVEIQGSEEPWWELPPYLANLVSRFHYSWLNDSTFRAYLFSSGFKQILSTIIHQRKLETVYPAAHQMFISFLTDLDSVRCVWLGLAPYASYEANGHAFSSGKATPSLEILEEAIRDDLDLGITFSLDYSLLSLRRQGVLLLNSRLTATSSGQAGNPIWDLYTRQVIAVLNQKKNLTWVLFGSVAKGFQSAINPLHTVLTENHPAFYARSGQPMRTKIFSQLQESLDLTF